MDSLRGMQQAHDWPLSREEKKTCALRLYDRDLSSTTELLASGEAALKALKKEVSSLRQSGETSGENPPMKEGQEVSALDGCKESLHRKEADSIKSLGTSLSSESLHRKGPAYHDISTPLLGTPPGTPRQQHNMQVLAAEEKLRLRRALVSTAAQFEQLSALLGRFAESDSEDEASRDRPRARSEGAVLAQPHSALRQRTPRHSRGSRRVSWADEPEPDPASSPSIDDQAERLDPDDICESVDAKQIRSAPSRSNQSTVWQRNQRKNRERPLVAERRSRKEEVVQRGRPLVAGVSRVALAAPTKSFNDAPASSMDFL